MKGKYTARAANRVAELDAGILAEKCAEIARLKADIKALEHAAKAERAERDALILARGDERARRLIAAARRDAVRIKEQSDEQRREAAAWLVEHWRTLQETYPKIAVYPDDVIEFLSELVGSSNVGPYFARALGVGGAKLENREHRRLTRDKVKANIAHNLQVLAGQGENPTEAKCHRDNSARFKQNFDRRKPAERRTDDE